MGRARRVDLASPYVLITASFSHVAAIVRIREGSKRLLQHASSIPDSPNVQLARPRRAQYSGANYQSGWRMR